MRGNMEKGLNYKDVCPQTMKKAQEIQKSLSPEHPSFIKTMKRSHVSNSFYTCPPTEFCKKHLPKSDGIIVFEVESGKTYEVKFLAMTPAFSGGWKGFAEGEKLLENDVLVFHLIEPGKYFPNYVPCKFKVYITRNAEFLPVDEALTVFKDDHRETTREVERKRTCKGNKKAMVKEIPTAKDKSTVRERDAGDDNNTRFTGVRKRNSGRYGSEIYIQDRNVWLGTFNTGDEAACKRQGFKAALNFPLDRSPHHSTTTANSTLPSGKHLKDTDSVYQKRASGSDLSDKLPTGTEDYDFATEIEVEKEGICVSNIKRPRLVSSSTLQEKIRVNDSSMKSSICPYSSDLSNSDGFQPSEFVSDFKSFKILINGKTIELEEQVQKSYFELCCSRKSCLHRHLMKMIDHELAASLISALVDIANQIRESNISTPQSDIKDWNKALDAFELFGLEVGFIRARLNRLSGLTLDLERYKEANIEFRLVEEKIAELKIKKKRLQEKLEGLGKEHETSYEEEASAPW